MIEYVTTLQTLENRRLLSKHPIALLSIRIQNAISFSDSPKWNLFKWHLNLWIVLGLYFCKNPSIQEQKWFSCLHILVSSQFRSRHHGQSGNRNHIQTYTMYIKHTGSQIGHITSFLKGGGRLNYPKCWQAKKTTPLRQCSKIRGWGGRGRVGNIENFYLNVNFFNLPYIVLYILPEKMGESAPLQ